MSFDSPLLILLFRSLALPRFSPLLFFFLSRERLGLKKLHLIIFFFLVLQMEVGMERIFFRNLLHSLKPAKRFQHTDQIKYQRKGRGEGELKKN